MLLLREQGVQGVVHGDHPQQAPLAVHHGEGDQVVVGQGSDASWAGWSGGTVRTSRVASSSRRCSGRARSRSRRVTAPGQALPFAFALACAVARVV